MHEKQKKSACRQTNFTFFLLFFFFVVNNLCPITAWAEPLVPLLVTKGTNLINIARNFCSKTSDWKTIAKINHLKSPYIIYAEGTIRVPLSILRTKNVSAQVASIEGAPQLVTEELQTLALRKDDLILPGQTIVTKEDEYVHLIFPGHKHTRIEPQSEMTLVYLMRLADQKLQAGLFLNRGRVVHRILEKLEKNEHFETKTALAVTGVRGTEFRLKVPDSETNIVETLQGQVTLSAAGKQLILDKGRGVKVKKGHPPTPQRKLPLKPDSPHIEEVYRILPVVINTPVHPNAEFMRIRIAADKQGQETIVEQVVKPGKYFTLLSLTDGHYQAYFTAIDDEGFESVSSDPAPLYVRTIPAAPIMSSPNTGLKTFDVAIKIRWLDSKLAQYYTVQIATDPEFTMLVDEQQTKEAFFTTPALAPGSYYFRVQLVADDGFTTLFSIPLAWTVVEQPKMDSLSSTVQGKEGITFQWSAVAGLSGYMLQIARDKQFNDLIVFEEKLTDPSYTITDHLSAGQYYVRMCALMDTGQKSPWTPVQIMTIDSAPPGPGTCFSRPGLYRSGSTLMSPPGVRSKIHA